jgi:hypothetical protein
MNANLSHKELVGILRTRGVECDYRADFRGVVEEKAIRGRVICGETRDADGFHGITFWVHAGGSGNYIGLWSGRVYKLPPKRSIAAFVTSVFSKGLLPSKRTPYVVPDPIVRKYQLVQVE